jgi:HD domain
MIRGMTNLRSGETDASSGNAWRDLTIFWGKARPPADRPSPSYHPLIFHSLDVAAVGQILLSRWPGLAAGLATALGWEVEAATALVIRLLALHDLGEIRPPVSGEIPRALRPELRTDRARHDGLRPCFGRLLTSAIRSRAARGVARLGGLSAARGGGYRPSRRTAANAVGSSRGLSPTRNDRGARLRGHARSARAFAGAAARPDASHPRLVPGGRFRPAVRLDRLQRELVPLPRTRRLSRAWRIIGPTRGSGRTGASRRPASSRPRRHRCGHSPN